MKTSFQFKLWRFILKSQFSMSVNNTDIDLKKARRFEISEPPNKIEKTCNIDINVIRGRNVFTLTSKNKKINDSNKTIIYFHGGAFISGITTPHWNFAQKLSNQFGLRIILPDYPVAPEKNYKDTIDFSIDLYKETLEKYNSSNIYLIGDSCGGGLSLSISQILLEKNLISPKKIILLSPWLDLSMSNPDIIGLQKNEVMLLPEKLKKAGELYSADLDVENPLISPINSNLAIYPELHLFIGTHDILLADSRKFVERAYKSGVKINLYGYDKMMHCWMIFPIPEAKKVVDKIGQIIENK